MGQFPPPIECTTYFPPSMEYPEGLVCVLFCLETVLKIILSKCMILYLNKILSLAVTSCSMQVFLIASSMAFPTILVKFNGFLHNPGQVQWLSLP